MNCLICSGETYPLKDKEISVIHHVCKTCGFTFKDPSCIQSFENERALYKNHQNTMENVGYVNMFERFLKAMIDPNINKGCALDFGSGPGPVLYELLKRRGFESAHYDPYFNPDQAVLEKSYDLITSTEVFEHLSEPLKIFKQLESMLETGGYLGIMTSLRPSGDDAFLTWWYRRDKTHIGFFTEDTFKRLCEKTNLEFIDTNHKNYFLFRKK